MPQLAWRMKTYGEKSEVKSEKREPTALCV